MSKYMNRGQVSVEFILIFSILLVIFSLIAIFTGKQLTGISRSKDYIHLKSSCEDVSNKINAAITAGDGFHSIIFLKDDLKVEATGKKIYCKYKNQIVAENILSSISGNFSSGKNLIKNIGGKISIES